MIDQTDPERFESFKDLHLEYIAKTSQIVDRHKVPAATWRKTQLEIAAAVRLLMTKSDDPRTELLAERKSWPSGFETEWLTLYGAFSSLLDRGVNRDNARAFLDRLLAQLECDAKGKADSGDAQISLPI